MNVMPFLIAWGFVGILTISLIDQMRDGPVPILLTALYALGYGVSVMSVDQGSFGMLATFFVEVVGVVAILSGFILVLIAVLVVHPTTPYRTAEQGGEMLAALRSR